MGTLDENIEINNSVLVEDVNEEEEGFVDEPESKIESADE